MSVEDPAEDRECPLCLEKLEIDDLNFYPCTCKYQVCRFCWHRIRMDENGLCPACRKPYPEDPANFQPITPSEMQQFKSERKQKEKKRNVSECRKHLSAYRVLQRNLVYVVGLSNKMADTDLLKRPEYFGKYGKVVKVAVGTLPSSQGSAPVYTAYVTFSKVEEALKAIMETNTLVFDGRMIKTSLGTTKYCSNFLRGQTCHKQFQECMYLHEVAPPDLSFTKEDMHQGKHTEYERKLLEKLSQHLETCLNTNQGQPKSEVSNDSSEQQGSGSASFQEKVEESRGDTAHGVPAPPAQPEPEPEPIPEVEEQPIVACHSSDYRNASPVPPLSPLVGQEKRISVDDFFAMASADPHMFEPSSFEAQQARFSSHNVHQPPQQRCGVATSEPNVASVPKDDSYNGGLSKYVDDLGFDPFAESMRGLEELIKEAEIEEQQKPDYFPMALGGYGHSFGNSRARDPFYNDMMGRDGFGLMDHGMRATHGDMFGQRGFNGYQNGYGNHVPDRQANQAQPLFSHMQQPQRAMPPLNEKGFYSNSYNNYLSENRHSTAPDPPAAYDLFNRPGQHSFNYQMNQSQSAMNTHENRESFKALLPNVNVSFVTSNDSRGIFNSSPTVFGSPSQQFGRNYHPMMAGYSSNNSQQQMMFGERPPGFSKWMTTPPPGFDAPGQNQGPS